MFKCENEYSIFVVNLHSNSNTNKKHVLAAIVTRNDAESFILIYLYGCFVHQWRTENIFASCGFYLIDSHGRKYIPSGHLSYIFVAR
jgi:hypothetical protein